MFKIKHYKYKLLIIIICIINIGIFNIKAERIELPSQYEIQQYINNLLSSYNSLIKFYEVNEPYFNDYKQYFQLYREEGYSFQIICVKADQNETKYINMIFIPISSDNPYIELDFNHVLNDYFPNFGIIKGTRVIISGGLFEYLDTIRYADFIMSLPSNEISNNTLVNSKELAEYLYNNNKNDIRIHRIEEIWKPFINENINIIMDISRLYYLKSEISEKINIWDVSYTYDLFLNDFNKFKTIVTHYKEQNLMIEKYNNFVSSDLIKNFKIKNGSEIHNKFIEIKDNIQYSEIYLFENFEEDLQDLKFIIQNEKDERTFIKGLQITLVLFTLSIIVDGLLYHRSEIKKYFKKINRKK